MRLVFVAAALAGALAAPAAAPAATVSSAARIVSLAALPGEANRVDVIPSPDGGIEVHDAEPVHAGTGCVAASSRTVHCPGPVLGVELDLGDGDDELRMSDALHIALVVAAGLGNDHVLAGEDVDLVDGGPGDDRLYGLEGDDSLLGGAGRDLLVGGEGADRADGGEGDDRLHGDGDALHATDTVHDGADTLEGGEGDDLLDGGLAGDVLHGGSGADTVSYATRSAPVTVRLDGEGASGQAGEGDDLDGTVEHAQGGVGGDLLMGADGANALAGGGGDDTLAGLGGADSLAGGDGADHLWGDGREAAEIGATADEDPAADEGDRLDGGPGADRLTGAAGLDELDAGDGEDVVDSREPGGVGGPGEVVRCGAGDDVARLDDGDSPLDCEDVLRNVAPPAVAPLPRPGAPSRALPPRGPGSQPPLGVPVARGATVEVPVHCASTCRVTITLRAVTGSAKRGRRVRRRGRVLGRATAVVGAGRRAVVVVPLSRSGRAYVLRRRRVTALADAVLRPAHGSTSRWSRPFKLRH